MHSYGPGSSFLLSALRFLDRVGNHESECHSPACILDWEKYGKPLHNFSAYQYRYRMPGPESGGVGNMWYSFNHGLAHFVVIDTETDFKNAPEENDGDSGVFPAGHFAPSGAQLKWLEADLKAADANRAERPWVFVGGHRPLYDASDSVDEENEARIWLSTHDFEACMKRGDCPKAKTPLKSAVMDAFEDLFHQYHVDVFFCGHQHAYGRSWPVYEGQVSAQNYDNPTEPVYIVSGSAGCDESRLHRRRARARRLRHRPKQDWIAFNDVQHYGFGELTVLNATAAHWAQVDSDSGAVLDECTITKKP